MGCFSSRPPPELKMAIVGLGGSGKSTIVKQLRLIYAEEQPFSQIELNNFAEILHYNAFQGLQDFLEYFDDEDYEEKENQIFSRQMLKMTRADFVMNTETAKKIAKLLSEPAVEKFRATYDLRRMDTEYNIEYIFQNLDRISAPDYVPTNQDILKARQRTSGLPISEFTTKHPKVTWKFVDAGGQQTEIRKWRAAFEGVMAIIFCVALDEFNVKSTRDPEKTLMEESIELFADLVDNNPSDSIILLFLNKIDLFMPKFSKLKRQFPQYKGTDFKTAISFVAKQYRNAPTVQKDIIVHQTCALDKEKMNDVFLEVMEVVLEARIRGSL